MTGVLAVAPGAVIGVACVAGVVLACALLALADRVFDLDRAVLERDPNSPRPEPSPPVA